jgi:dephospho-CoA kinase
MTSSRPPLVTAGLTGGIASGKSTVAKFFHELGARVIDADLVAHQVLRRLDVVRDVAARFGADVLTPDGRVDRRRLGPRVFADAAAREWLNGRVHPGVREEIARLLEEERRVGVHPLALVDVPLLVESGEPHRYGPLVLAWCPPEIQLARLQSRDGLSAAQARQRLAAQWPIESKRDHADYIIDTTGPFEDTRGQVETAFRSLLARGETSPRRRNG